MFTKDFNRPEDAIQFSRELSENKDVYALAYSKPDGTAYVKWIELGKYTSYDGKEYVDEAWTTEAGVIMNVGDLTEDHAKNILRMIIRQDRKALEDSIALKDALVAALTGFNDDDEDLPSLQPIDPNRVTLSSLLDDSLPPKGSLLN